MKDAIRLLRNAADKSEGRARQAVYGQAQAEMVDIAAGWHLLSGEAAKLLVRYDELAKQLARSAARKGEPSGPFVTRDHLGPNIPEVSKSP